MEAGSAGVAVGGAPEEGGMSWSSLVFKLPRTLEKDKQLKVCSDASGLGA